MRNKGNLGILFEATPKEAAELKPEDVLTARYCPKCGGEVEYESYKRYNVTTGDVSEVVYHAVCKDNNNLVAQTRVVRIVEKKFGGLGELIGGTVILIAVGILVALVWKGSLPPETLVLTLIMSIPFLIGLKIK